MGIISFLEEFESPVSAARFFKASVLEATTVFPMLAPDVLVSATNLKGDGGMGTVKIYNFTKANHYSYVKEHHHFVDKENFVDKYTWIEGGDMGTKLLSYTSHVIFEPTSNGGCICRFGVEYKTFDGVDYTQEMKEDRDNIQLMGYKLVETYLIANPDAYA